MKTTLIVMVALLVTACGTASFGQKEVNRNPSFSSAPGAAAGEAKYEVRVIRNDAELASYDHSGPRAVALHDGQSFEMFFASNDNKKVLTVAIQGANAGSYPLPSHTGAPKQGEARLEFRNDSDPLVLIPIKGELKLETYADKRCSGSFTGVGTDLNGVKFSIEGRFINLTVKNVEE